MAIFDVKQPTAIHHALGWVIVLGGLAWALSTCTSSVSRDTAITQSDSPSGGLSKIRIGSTNWHKDGFGIVMVASFAIYNDNDYPISSAIESWLHRPLARATKAINNAVVKRG